MRIDLLDNEGVDIGVLAEIWLGRNTEVLFFELASHRVLVTEDEVKLWHTCQYTTMVAEARIFTLLPGQVKSGPNMITQGVVSENSFPLVWKPSSSNLM